MPSPQWHQEDRQALTDHGEPPQPDDGVQAQTGIACTQPFGQCGLDIGLTIVDEAISES